MLCLKRVVFNQSFGCSCIKDCAADALAAECSPLINQIIFIFIQDGVILGADTRATEGPIVADKNCEKIHYMAPNIYCCGAGTAADTEAVTGTFKLLKCGIAILR